MAIMVDTHKRPRAISYYFGARGTERGPSKLGPYKPLQRGPYQLSKQLRRGLNKLGSYSLLTWRSVMGPLALVDGSLVDVLIEAAGFGLLLTSFLLTIYLLGR